MILERTEDVNIRNVLGNTALHILGNGRLAGPMVHGRTAAARLLIVRGADVSFRNEDGKTAGGLFTENDPEHLLSQDPSWKVLLAGNTI